MSVLEGRHEPPLDPAPEMGANEPGHPRAIADIVAMLFVSALSLVVLLYVALGTAREGYKHLVIERVLAQGQIVQSTIETFLRPGLPLRQFVGFNRMAANMAATGIADVSVFDIRDALVFTDDSVSIAPMKGPSLPVGADNIGQLRETATQLQIELPLRNRFEQVGRMILTLPRTAIDDRVQSHMTWVGALALAAVPILLITSFIFAPADGARRRRWLNGAFAAMYLIVAGSVIAGLVTLYSEGSQAKGEALVRSLGHRLKPVVDYQLNISEVDGIDRVFSEYRALNPEISGIALSVGGRVVVHTDDHQVGRPWAGAEGSYEYAVSLTGPDVPLRVEVLLAIPKQVIFSTVLRSVKNFAALFVASALFATLFLQVARSIRSRGEMRAERRRWGFGRKTRNAEPAPALQGEAALALIRPLFFLAIFIEHLSYAFLPQFVQGVVQAEGLPSGLASLPFIAYYLVFALVLLPAGQIEAKFGPKMLIVAGLVAAMAGLLVLPLGHGLAQLVAGRMLTGIGQGMVFIGVQSFILANTGTSQRTRGASIIVVGFQGGMISGMAIGSLLVGYIGETSIFRLAAVLAGLTTLYAWLLVPGHGDASDRAAAGPGRARAFGVGTHSLRSVLADIAFLKTIVLIGIPAKAVLTGVVLFGLPLLMTQLGFHKEDIGQVTMVYAGAVIGASALVAKLVDQRGRSGLVLFWGSTLTAGGLLLLASVGLGSGVLGQGAGQTTLILAAVIVIGVAHGLINAPILTHVSELDVSAQCGSSTVAATYRFLERIGHAIGPMLVGQMLILSGNNPSIFVWLAGGLLVCGVLFVAPAPHLPPQQQPGAA